MRRTGISDSFSVVASSIGMVVSLLALVFSVINVYDIDWKAVLPVGASVAAGVLVGLMSKSLSSLLRKTSGANRVFVSYSHEHKLEADQVIERLRKSGAKVWVDREQIHPGDSIFSAVKSAIDDADSMVVLVSEHTSPNVIYEIGLARGKGIRVIPVIVGGDDVTGELKMLDLEQSRYIDLRRDSERGINELLEVAF